MELQRKYKIMETNRRAYTEDAQVHIKRQRAIIDKEVKVSEGAMIGVGEDNIPNRDEPSHLASGITLIGKRAVVPAGARIGRNCKIMPATDPTDFPADGVVLSGNTVEKHAARPEMSPVPG